MNLTFLRTLEGLRFPAMDSLMQAVTELGSEIVFGGGPGALLVHQQAGGILLTDRGLFRYGAQPIF